MPYFVGLDLGHSADYTALALVERIEEQLPTGLLGALCASPIGVGVSP
jgi:hypothetical protein